MFVVVFLCMYLFYLVFLFKETPKSIERKRHEEVGKLLTEISEDVNKGLVEELDKSGIDGMFDASYFKD